MKIVIALGGNALGIDPKEQKENVRKVSPYLAKIIKQGNEVVITHGNPPARAMYDAAKVMRSKIVDIAREVYGFNDR